MATQSAEPIRVGSIDELKTGGCRVVTGGGHAVAVFYHDGRVYAVDNRCPHLGFPLGRAMLNEDAGFHSFQIVDAGFSQYRQRRGTESGRHVLIGMARYLAAHAPTSRAVGQTYQIALRLHRGEEIFRE